MADKFRIAEIKPKNFEEGILSLQLRAVIAKWVAFAARYYKDWNHKPGCGHFFGGVYHYGVETSATIMATAVIASIGEYPEKIIGVSQKQLIDMTISSIRYLCFTHHTGPSDCVREKGKNPRTSEKKWGHTPGNYFIMCYPKSLQR